MRTPLGSARAWLAALVTLVLGTSSCTAIVKLDEHGDVTNRCLTDTDCTSHDPGTFCGPQKTCTPITGFCATNKDCIDRTGSETYVCQKGATPAENHCVGLLNEVCPKMLADPGDLLNDDVVILGTPWLTSWATIFQGGLDGMELARRDFKGAAGGLPPLPGKKTSRPIVVVVCDIPLTDTDQHKNAIDHLLDIGVKALIGPVRTNFLTYALNKAIPLGVPVFSVDSSSQGFNGDTHGLYFTNGVPPGGSTVRDLIVGVHEQILRTAGKTGDIKVAMLTSGLATDAGTTSFLYDHLTFNGKSAAANGANYAEFDYGDTAADGAVQLAQAVSQLVAFNPDVVIGQGSGVELGINQIEAAGIHPRYALSSSMATTTLAQFMDGQPNGRVRVLGERPGRQTSDRRVSTFVNRFNATFPDVGGLYGLGITNYDLFYYIAYGIGGLGDKPITGANISDVVLHRFQPGGVAAATTPDKILSTLQALQAGSNVDMDGTATIGNFKSDGSGTLLYSDLTVWCFDPDTSLTARQKDAGLSYRSDDLTKLNGTLTCF